MWRWFKRRSRTPSSPHVQFIKIDDANAATTAPSASAPSGLLSFVLPEVGGANFVVSSVQFLGEQDGVPERDLKVALTRLLEEDIAATRAYLARVSYGQSDTLPFHVAICIKYTGSQPKALKHAIGRVFATIFGSHEHLDILFLSAQQEGQLALVCRPFFDRGNAIGASRLIDH